MARPTNRPTNEVAQGKRPYNRDSRLRPDLTDVLALKAFTGEQRDEIADKLGGSLTYKEKTYLLDQIDLQVRSYRRSGDKLESKDKHALKEELRVERKTLRDLEKQLQGTIAFYESLDEESVRKLAHRAAKVLRWKGERSFRALIGQRIIAGVFSALQESIQPAIAASKLPPGKDQSSELNVLVEALARIWCAANGKDFPRSDFGLAKQPTSSKARPEGRAFIETVLHCAKLSVPAEDLSNAINGVVKYGLTQSASADERDASDETRIQRLKQRLLPPQIKVTIRV